MSGFALIRFIFRCTDTVNIFSFPLRRRPFWSGINGSYWLHYRKGFTACCLHWCFFFRLQLKNWDLSCTLMSRSDGRIPPQFPVFSFVPVVKGLGLGLVLGWSDLITVGGATAEAGNMDCNVWSQMSLKTNNRKHRNHGPMRSRQRDTLPVGVVKNERLHYPETHTQHKQVNKTIVFY